MIHANEARLISVEKKRKNSEYHLGYRTKNKELVSQRKKLWYQRNKDKVLKRVIAYDNNRLHTNLQYKLGMYLRSRMRNALKGKIKKGSAVNDLGCTIEELKIYLESKFLEGMTWDNYGRNGWHIDHIIPLSRVDLTSEFEFKKVCHYTNLQPLWASDNIRKGNKI